MWIMYKYLISCFLVISFVQDALADKGVIDEINSRIGYYKKYCGVTLKKDIDPLKEIERQVIMTDEEKNVGLILFNRNKEKIVFPSSRPLPEEKITTDTVVKVWSCRNQTRSFRISAYCIKELKELKLTLNNLQLKNGNEKIESSQIRIHSIIPFPIIWGRRFIRVESPSGYEWLPTFLAEDISSIDVPLRAYKEVEKKTDYAQSFLFQVKIPSTQKPGIYEGKISVSIGKAVVKEIAISFEVLPPILDNCDWWLRGFFEGDGPGVDGYKMLKEYGFNTTSLWADKVFHGWGQGAKYGWEKFDIRLKELKESGIWPNKDTRWVYFLQERCFGNRVANWQLGQKYPSTAYKDEYVKRLKEVYDRCKFLGIGYPIIVVNDEPSLESLYGSEMVDTMFDLSDIVKKNIPEAKTYCVIFNAKDWQRYANHPKNKAIDYWVSNNICPYGVKALTSIHGEMGEYRGGHLIRLPANLRFDIGYRSFLFNTKLSFRWANIPVEFSFGKSLTSAGDYCFHTVQYRSKISNKIIPTLALDSLREGINDRLVLETLVILAKDASYEIKEKVKVFLDKLRNDILIKMSPSGKSTGAGITSWPSDNLDWTWAQDMDKMKDINFLETWQRESADLSTEIFLKK